MFTITLPEVGEFKAMDLQFEHSLVSLSKWEQKYKRPFYSLDPKTNEEAIDYIRMMLLTPNVPDRFVELLDVTDANALNAYINEEKTATTFREDPTAPKSREVVTYELIYSWMIAFGIPFDPCERWHMSNLFTLIRIRSVQTSKQTPMTKAQQREQYQKLNAERKAKLGTSG